MSYYDPVTYGILFDATAARQQPGKRANGSSAGSPQVKKTSRDRP
jgi:3-deoxy-D-manno-octulosonic acid (KDO) 8-phosphate synthase